MATTYKSLSTNDIVTTKTLLHEAIPITGTILSGTYGTNNIKNYTHGMFQSVYDYPHLSSSANHIFDITMGFHVSSSLSSSSNWTQQSKKNNVYNQMAQVLMGYDENGVVRRFDEDGNLSGGSKMDNVHFFNFARLLTKDEIKKGSFVLELGVNDAYATDNTTFTERIKLSDYNSQNDYRVNSPAGDYGILYASSSLVLGATANLENEGTLGSAFNSTAAAGVSGHNPKVGLIFYQAGIAVITSSVFLDLADSGMLANSTGTNGFNATQNAHELFVSGAVSASCDALRNRIYNLSFNNTTELNSSVYFCRAHHNEFNYSTNPTYLNASKLVVKNNASDSPVSYATAVGLYSADNELLAMAKLSEPLKKDPSNELTLRVRLDY